MSGIGGIRLLEDDPGLGSYLDAAEQEEARRLIVVPAVDLRVGELDLPQLRADPDVAGHCWGLLVISGMLLNHVQIANRACLRLYAAGDLILLDGPVEESIPSTWWWSVRRRTRVALLDDRLLTAARRWPTLMRAVHERAAQLGRQSTLNRAISQLPRVEDRLLAFLWTLADRYGNVRPDGIRLDLPLTHDELGQLIGARRPTVSLGLRKLAERELLEVEDDGYILTPESRHALAEAGDDAEADGDAQ